MVAHTVLSRTRLPVSPRPLQFFSKKLRPEDFQNVTLADLADKVTLECPRDNNINYSNDLTNGAPGRSRLLRFAELTCVASYLAVGHSPFPS